MEVDVQHSQCICVWHEGRSGLQGKPIQSTFDILHLWLSSRSNTVSIPADTHPAFALSPNGGTSLDDPDVLLCCGAERPHRLCSAFHPRNARVRFCCWSNHPDGVLVYTSRIEQTNSDLLFSELCCRYVQWISASCDLQRHERDSWTCWLEVAVYILWNYLSVWASLGILCYTGYPVQHPRALAVAREPRETSRTHETSRSQETCTSELAETQEDSHALAALCLHLYLDVSNAQNEHRKAFDAKIE